ncbi:AAA domain-containing protein [Pseudomonas syringae]|uniref:sigma 54-interacting transcriptional regulator n=1 Tax=Pseudomonas syringae TaxID=317 RepID=UPI001F19EBC8|nr:sigma 54-interacting transcriptional regulator [Pseudomonas syringae]MCF5709546.1 AAA domain-containing protein [Pseudomonas syringae]
MSPDFTSAPNSATYAHALCSAYARLSQAADSTLLLNDFVCSACRLNGCELGLLFLFDMTLGHLNLSVQVLDGAIQADASDGNAIDYSSESLLKYTLSQGKPVSVNEVDCRLYETGFLPAGPSVWRTLLCIPLTNRDTAVVGLLVCASSEGRSLEAFAESLAVLGSFVLSQHSMLELRRPRAALPSIEVDVSHYGLISESVAMRETCRLVGKVIQSPYTVLLTGETGTGKEVISRAIHEHGPRRTKDFVVQNCAALPESLLESELFGYRKGAFTGADRDRRGLFDVAHEGTLLLDEIGDMPMGLQAKLLRVLQEGEIRPLGSNTVRKVNVRIIAATHRDLPALIAEGRFREDLYYRLAQFPIALPPLRERIEDIEPMARHFAASACIALKREPVQWSHPALAALSGYAFPGNVRQLKGFVERAVLLSECGELLPEHFSVGQGTEVSCRGLTFRERMEQFEKGLLIEYLRSHNGNRTLTARTLGLSRRTLLYRMAHLNIGKARQ